MANKSNNIDQDFIKDLATLLNDADLSEIEVEQGSLRVRLSRQTQQAFAPAPMMMAAPALQATPPQEPAPPASAPAASSHNSANSVPSPMVGTVYFSPSPGSDPFISIGSTVKEGQTILIIEAMKTMNQIPAPKSGTVTAILVEDASPVEFGHPLIVIE
jgi:acetyl-CoA carboxylase biotin carboxyl carrier protein